MVNYSCESLDAHKGVTPVGGVKYSCEALEVVPGDISPSTEGFWESFWRNGLIVAIIQKCKSNIMKIKAECDKYVASPASFDNGDAETDIRALKILPKGDQLKLLDGLYKLGEVIKKDAKDMSKAKRENYERALKDCGIRVTFDKVKGQYKWDCWSLWGARLLDSISGYFVALGLGLTGLVVGSVVGGPIGGLVGAVTAAYYGTAPIMLIVDRKWQLALGEVPAIMADKGYVQVKDYVDLCKATSKLMAQALQLEGIKPSGSKLEDKVSLKLVRSAIEVYQREVREVGYSMTKVMVGLGSTTGFLAWW